MNKYIVILSNEGLDALIDATEEYEKWLQAEVLGDEHGEYKIANLNQGLMLRIRFNPHLEIKGYIIDSEIPYEDLKTALEENSELVNHIKENYKPTWR